MPEKQKLNVRMPADLHLELAVLAYEQGLAMNTLAVMALRNYLGYVATHNRLPGTHPTPRRPPAPSKAQERPSRNAPCHCGSGMKYKRCCYPV